MNSIFKVVLAIFGLTFVVTLTAMQSGCDRDSENGLDSPSDAVVISVSTPQNAYEPSAEVQFAITVRDQQNQPVEGVVVGVYDNMRLISAATPATDVSGQTSYASVAPTEKGVYCLSFFTLNSAAIRYSVMVDVAEPLIESEELRTVRFPVADQNLGTQSENQTMLDRAIGYHHSTIVETFSNPFVIMGGEFCAGSAVVTTVAVADIVPGDELVAAGLTGVVCGAALEFTMVELAKNTAKNTMKLAIDEMTQLSDDEKQQYKDKVDDLAGVYNVIVGTTGMLTSVKEAPNSGKSIFNYKLSSSNQGNLANVRAQKAITDMLEAGDLISDYGEVYGGTVNETASSISVSGAVRANDQVCSEDLESYRVLSIGFCDHSVSGPTAYYPLNGNAMDASGHGRDGTLYGTTPATDRNGYSSGAIHLDGNQHFVALPAMDIPSSLSIVLWLKTSVADPNQWPVNMFLVDRDICYFARDWSIGIGYGGRVVFNTGRSSEDAPLVSSSIVADGSWHFVCIVRDATEEQKRVFVGEDVDANADFENTAFANQSRPIFLGASVCNTSSHTYFDGDVDDLRIYDRVLTQDEITDLANRP